MKRLGLILSLFAVAVSTASASVSVSVNGVNYTIPQRGEKGWGDQVTSWIQSVSSGMLQKAGGTFTLTADTDFGASFGLASTYYKTRSANLATSGQFRLANTDLISWRNAGNSANLGLGVDSSNRLIFNGVPFFSGTALTASRPVITDASGVLTTEATLSPLRGGTGQDFSAATGLVKASSGTFSAATLVNADVSASAAIATSKLAAVTASRALVSDGSGFVSASGVTSTTLGFLDATSSVQTQIDSKQATGNYITALTGDVTASGPGSVTATIGANKVTDAMIRQGAGLSVIGVTGSSTANVADITAGTTNQILRRNGTTIGFGSINLASSGAVGTSILPIANGGTGQATAQTAIDALLPTQTSNSGKYLTTNGTTSSWGTVASGSASLTVVSKTANYSITSAEDVVLASSSGGAITLTLPAASGYTKPIYIKKTDSSVNAVNVNRAGSDTIDGGTTLAITQQYQTIMLVSDGTSAWYIF